MFDKLPQEQRNQFIKQTFIVMPISLLLGMIAGFIILRFIGFAITLRGAIFAIIFMVLTVVWSLKKHYRKLISDIENKQVEKT